LRDDAHEMEYVIQFDEEGQGVTATISGSSDLAGQISLIKDVVHDARYSAGMPILFDYSGLDERRSSAGEVQQLGQFVATLDEAFADAKLAVVVPDTVAYGLGRMSQARIDTRLRMRFFYDRGEAEAWLQE
jgi:hypothetical protein